MNNLTLPLFLLIPLFGALALFYYSRYKKLHNESKVHEAQKEQFHEVVHELRAPLTAMKDAAVLLNDTNLTLSEDEKTKLHSLIRSECLDLLDLVNGVLDASKVMNKKLAIKKTPNDLHKLIEEKVLMYSPHAKTKGLEIVSEIGDGISSVLYDHKYLGQVLNNLISNSLKYTPTGGKITVSAHVVGTNVEVSVFDNGMGVPDEKQKELFTKFTSINTIDSKIPSTGLGLYVAKGIIEAHGGTISVTSHEGRGYKISFTLPLSSAPASIATAPTPTPAVQTPGTAS